jgi:hypothetical protein
MGSNYGNGQRVGRLGKRGFRNGSWRSWLRAGRGFRPAGNSGLIWRKRGRQIRFRRSRRHQLRIWDLFSFDGTVHNSGSQPVRELVCFKIRHHIVVKSIEHHKLLCILG